MGGRAGTSRAIILGIVSERGRDEEVNGMVHRSLCAASSNEACLIKLA